MKSCRKGSLKIPKGSFVEMKFVHEKDHDAVFLPLLVVEF